MKDRELTARIAIIGGGTIGSVTALQLAQRGAEVTVYDRFQPPHRLGAHAGESRLLRSLPYLEQTPFEQKLLASSLSAWEEIERQTDRHLITRCGGLIIDNSEVERFKALRSSVNKDVTYLRNEEFLTRFPQFHRAAAQEAILDKNAGIIDPQTAVSATLELARSKGAKFCFNNEVKTVEEDKGFVRVDSSGGSNYYDRVVICSGAFSKQIIPSLPIIARRLLLGWFVPQKGYSHWLKSIPSFVWMTPEPERLFVYGGPSYDGKTLKIGIEAELGQVEDPGAEDGVPTDEDIGVIRNVVADKFPWLNPVGDRFEMHIDGWSPDQTGLLGTQHNQQKIVIATGWSGYGFKIAPELGRIAAAIALGIDPDSDLRELDPNRTLYA